MTADQFRAILRKACKAAGSARVWADAHGISPQYVCDVLGGRKEPGWKICNALDCVRVVTYRRKKEDE